MVNQLTFYFPRHQLTSIQEMKFKIESAIFEVHKLSEIVRERQK